MTRGLRKLCDVYEPDEAQALDAELLRLGIAHDRFNMRPRRTRLTGPIEFVRYYVDQNDLTRAREALPLVLRGFRKIGQAVSA
jgi:hypothetical protein